MQQSKRKSRKRSVISLSTHKTIDVEEQNHLSLSDIKHLFFIWFNSISTDGKTLNLSQFSRIINRIFTSSVSETDVSQLFYECSKGKNVAYYHVFLSSENHTFAEIMETLIQRNESTLNALIQSVPTECTNNASNNTLQKMLCDQRQQITTLKEWIVGIGIPAHSTNNTLNLELSELAEDKSRVDFELQIVENEHNYLKSDQDLMNTSFSQLKDDFTYSVQQITDLKALTEELKVSNANLEASSDALRQELVIGRQKNKEFKQTIDELNKLNIQCQEKIEQLNIKITHQSQQITNLTSIKHEMDTAMERCAVNSQQQTETINLLQSSLDAFQSKTPLHQTYSLDRDQNSVEPPNSRPQSYVFSLRTPLGLNDNTRSVDYTEEFIPLNSAVSKQTLSTFMFNNPQEMFTIQEQNGSFALHGYVDDSNNNTLRTAVSSNESTLRGYECEHNAELKRNESLSKETEESDEFETEKTPFMDVMHKTRSRLSQEMEDEEGEDDIVPREFFEQTQNQCVMFGWRLW